MRRKNAKGGNLLIEKEDGYYYPDGEKADYDEVVKEFDTVIILPDNKRDQDE